MIDEYKIKLADMVISFLSDNANQQLKDEIPVMVGTLNKQQGLVGFKTAEIGHPVFEFKERYFIYLDNNDGKTTVKIPYYKNTLKDYINFNN